MNALFRGQSPIDQIHKVVSVLGTPPKSWATGYKLAQQLGVVFPDITATPMEQIVPSACPEGIDLLKRMLQYEPSKRPTAQQILKHPYFTKSMSNKTQKNAIWGSTSIREKARKKTFQDLYKNSGGNIFNIQNNSKAHTLHFDREDNDWEIDKELENLMNDKIPNHTGDGVGEAPPHKSKSKSNYSGLTDSKIVQFSRRGPK